MDAPFLYGHAACLRIALRIFCSSSSLIDIALCFSRPCCLISARIRSSSLPLIRQGQLCPRSLHENERR